MEINKYIDQTLLKRDATKKEVDEFVQQAIEYNFKTICIHPIWIKYVKEKLVNTDIEITAVIGFPYGTQTTESKVFEGKDAIKKGANELDFVAPVSMVHDRDEKYIKNELTKIRKATKGSKIKLILETGLLDKKEIEYISKLAVECKWDFLKTSTGIQTTGAKLEDVKLMVKIADGKAEVKASGGVKTYEDAVAMINAGATRIGTSSGVELVNKKTSKTDY